MLDGYGDDDLARLRELTVLFLDAKGIVGAGGHEVTPLQRVLIAVQACVLVLNLDLAWYDGFENIVVYPGEFVPALGMGGRGRRGAPQRGAAGRGGDAGRPRRAFLAGRRGRGRLACDRNEPRRARVRAQDGHAQRRCERLSAAAAGDRCRAVEATLTAAFDDFVARVDRNEDTTIDGYAAESPGEFFAVLSEVFFADPALLLREYPAVYRLFTRFYRQDPAARLPPPEPLGLA